MSNATVLVRFSAEVNGKRRKATVRVYKDRQDLLEAEAVVMNDETAYREFYRGATQEDFDADLLNARVRPYR